MYLLIDNQTVEDNRWRGSNLNHSHVLFNSHDDRECVVYEHDDNFNYNKEWPIYRASN